MRAGLRELVGDENLAKIDPRQISTIPIGTTEDGTPVVVRLGRYGPYVQVGEEGDRGSIPPDLAPDELTLEVALELARLQSEGPQALGTDPRRIAAVMQYELPSLLPEDGRVRAEVR